MFSVVADKDCTVLPPEADPNPPSTSTTTTETPYLGIISNLDSGVVIFSIVINIW